MIEISDEYVIACVDGEIVAAALRSWYATADGNGAWIVSTHLRDCSPGPTAGTRHGFRPSGRGRGPAGR
jgi:hypothetical protein